MNDASQEILVGKKAILCYSGLPEKIMDECIKQGLPCFKVSGRYISHKHAIDAWIIEVSNERLGIAIPR